MLRKIIIGVLTTTALMFTTTAFAAGTAAECQIASNCDPHFACKSDPFGAAETGGAKPYIAEQSRSRRPVSGEREIMRGS